MAEKALPTPEVLRQLLRYDPETGKLFWRERGPEWFASEDRIGPVGRAKIWNKRYAGKKALTADCKGYRHGAILGRNYSAHRVAWTIHYGNWPSDQIDHVDGDKSNNRLRNLREATHIENCLNRGSRKGSTSKYLGVDFSTAHKKWRAQIKPNGKVNVFLGLFENEKAAALAYNGAAKKHHGDFARLNKV